MKLDAAAGMRMRDGFTLDPYRRASGLAAAAVRARAPTFFEQSPVKKVRFTRKYVDVITAHGTIRTGHVVVATGSATAEFKPLRRHFKRRETYLALTEPVPAAVRKQLGDPDVVLSDARTPRASDPLDAGDRLLIGGADQDETPPRTRAGGARAAHRSADVRAADDVSGDLRAAAGVRLGACRTARPPTA